MLCEYLSYIFILILLCQCQLDCCQFSHLIRYCHYSLVYLAEFDQHDYPGDRHKQRNNFSILRPGHEHDLPVRQGVTFI